MLLLLFLMIMMMIVMMVTWSLVSLYHDYNYPLSFDDVMLRC